MLIDRPASSVSGMRWPTPSKSSSIPWCTRRSRCSRSASPTSVSRSTVPCSSTPARIRRSMCSRLWFSSTTESMPARCRRCASTSPAGSAPTMPTWVRISERVRRDVAAYRDPAGVGERVEVGRTAEAHPGARVAYATERRDGFVDDALVVDVHDPGRDPFCQGKSTRHVAGEAAQRQPVPAVGGELRGLVDVGEAYDRSDRPEDFLRVGRHLRAYRVEYRRPVEQPLVPTAGRQPRPTVHSGRHQRVYLVPLRRVDRKSTRLNSS